MKGNSGNAPSKAVKMRRLAFLCGGLGLVAVLNLNSSSDAPRRSLSVAARQLCNNMWADYISPGKLGTWEEAYAVPEEQVGQPPVADPEGQPPGIGDVAYVLSISQCPTQPFQRNLRELRRLAGSNTCGVNSGPMGGADYGPTVDLGSLTNYIFFFDVATSKANWQGATKGFYGDVAVDGITAAESTSGSVPYAGTIYSNDATLDAWQDIVDGSASASGVVGQTGLINDLTSDFNTAFNTLDALPADLAINSDALNGLNYQNGQSETIVIDIVDGFSVSSNLFVYGDAGDVFVIRWDKASGYGSQCKFQGGGGIIPSGELTPGNFVNLAGDINSSGGGSTPPIPFPQGPRAADGTGALIADGDDFSGGGFFTGYWLTIGNPTKGGESSDLSNAIFVGGWYSNATKWSMTSGTSGVHVCPNPGAFQAAPALPPPTNAPVAPPTNAPVAPVAAPTNAPVAPPTNAPVVPVPAPTDPAVPVPAPTLAAPGSGISGSAFRDSAAMVKYGACEYSKGEGAGAHDYTMYAIVHPDAVQCTDALGGTYDVVKVLQDLDYIVETWGEPLTQSSIQDQYTRDNIAIKDFNILNAFRIPNHEVAIMLTLDTFVKNNLDMVADTIMTGTPSAGLETTANPTNPIALYTREYYSDAPDYYNGISLDFFAIKPNMDTYNGLVHLLQNGFYDPQTGWGGYGNAFPGGLSPKGFLSWWALSNSNVAPIDYCVYNNHMGNPVTTDLQGNPSCENNKELVNDGCTDCRLAETVRAVTYAVCGHPWDCQYSLEPRCQDLHRDWFTMRIAFEEGSPYPFTDRNGEYHPEVYQGFCTQEGPAGYKPMGYTEEFPIGEATA